MNRVLAFLFLTTFCSCEFIEKKKVYSNDIVEEELQTFNWNDVDEYPSFESCEATLDKANKKACFENTLREILNKNLAKYKIIVSEEIHDTIHLKITIDNDGEFVVDDIISNEKTQAEIPKLDSLLRKSLDSLPKIYPAIKRSQHVKTQFSLPVIIKID
ncbi:hypothetical protein [Psychroserpens sp. Hel_I_66]|uniref:hypothetical protein n=1 Tax=Psychroserpens sp. Hel_I_66 TaxID=1250004 RepID=UPI0006475FA7|nr:hypothetical protein [Psychroserpens sp. Hel_I_66]